MEVIKIRIKFLIPKLMEGGQWNSMMWCSICTIEWLC